MDVISPMNEHENEHTPPVLDTLIQNRPIQMLKAIVPYLYEPQQRMVSMMVRMIELQRTMQLFDAAPEMQAQELRICSNDSPTERTHLIPFLWCAIFPQDIQNLMGTFCGRIVAHHRNGIRLT